MYHEKLSSSILKTHLKTTEKSFLQNDLPFNHKQNLDSSAVFVIIIIIVKKQQDTCELFYTSTSKSCKGCIASGDVKWETGVNPVQSLLL